MARTKALVFDWDDTLLCSVQHKWAQHRAVAKEFYDIDLPVAMLRKHWGLPTRDLVRVLYKDTEEPERMLQNFHALDHRYPKTVFEHSRSVIDQLATDYVIGIVTNAKKQSVMEDLSRFEFPMSRISFVHTYEDTGFYKPDPRVFEQALAILKARNITDLTYVGDSPLDCQAAHNAGVSFIGVTTGVWDEAVLRRVGAETIIGSLTELAETLRLECER